MPDIFLAQITYLLIASQNGECQISNGSDIRNPQSGICNPCLVAVADRVRDILDEETVSSPLVIGVASLPFGSPDELDFILEVRG